MEKPTPAVGAAVAALLGACMPALSAESHRCAAILDDAQRLACYDGTFGRPARTPVVATVTAPAPAVPTVPAPQAAPAAAQRIPAAAPPAAVTPPQTAPRAKDEPVSGRVVAVGRLSNDRFAATLDNGQLWMQLERDVTAEVKVGDTVTVKPGMLGSWMLETRGGVRTRVRLAR